MHKFNRQVLEQVAKDGRVYSSLAKEMARYLLDEEDGATKLPTHIKIMLASSSHEAERYAEYKTSYPIYQFDYRDEKDPVSGDHFGVYALTRRTP